MSTTLTIGGSAVTLAAVNSFPAQLHLDFRGISTLTIPRRGGVLPGLPDPWLGKPVSLSINGTVRFQGDVVDMDPSYTGLGWITTYQCRCLRNRGDRIPVTDSNTLTDSCAYNIPSDDINHIASRAGRTVGEILADVLTMVANATNLDAKGLGGYATLTPPTLPSTTVADLAALTLIPPSAVYVQGEKFLAALEGFLSQWAPNVVMWIDQSNGQIRFTPLVGMTNHTFTLGVDRVDPTPLRRSVADSYQRVIIRGQPQAEPAMITLSSGGLVEDFAWGTLTNAAAKAAYVPSDYDTDSLARSQGSCACTDTLNVVVNPDDNTQAWAANYWDQTSTGKLGNAYFYYSAGSGITQFVSRRIVSNTALAAGGTCTLTLDRALPATNYDHFAIYGLSSGSSLVYRKYKVVDADQAAAMARVFTYPAAFVGVNGDTATLTSAPMGSVCWSSSGLPPYQEFPMNFTLDPSSGNVIFSQSLYTFLGNKPPSDVRCLLAINTGALTAIKPDSGYEGTSHTVDGLSDTLTVTCDGWRDPVNQASMEAYAQDMLDSVKDTIVEGEIVIHDLFAAALSFGTAASVTGDTYSTGWEGLALPILEATLTWNSGTGTNYTTTLHCSNRRAHYTSGAFLRPTRSTESALGGEGYNTAGLMGIQEGAAVGADLSAFQGGGQEFAADFDPVKATAQDVAGFAGQTNQGLSDFADDTNAGIAKAFSMDMD